VTQEKQNTRDPLDQQQLPPQGKPRTAVVAIVIIVLLIVIAFFIGSRFSKPGRGFFLIPGAAVQALPPPQLAEPIALASGVRFFGRERLPVREYLNILN
jgi:hypothetical protein